MPKVTLEFEVSDKGTANIRRISTEVQNAFNSIKASSDSVAKTFGAAGEAVERSARSIAGAVTKIAEAPVATAQAIREVAAASRDFADSASTVAKTAALVYTGYKLGLPVLGAASVAYRGIEAGAILAKDATSLLFAATKVGVEAAFTPLGSALLIATAAYQAYSHVLDSVARSQAAVNLQIDSTDYAAVARWYSKLALETETFRVRGTLGFGEFKQSVQQSAAAAYESMGAFMAHVADWLGSELPGELGTALQTWQDYYRRIDMAAVESQLTQKTAVSVALKQQEEIVTDAGRRLEQLLRLRGSTGGSLERAPITTAAIDAIYARSQEGDYLLQLKEDELRSAIQAPENIAKKNLLEQELISRSLQRKRNREDAQLAEQQLLKEDETLREQDREKRIAADRAADLAIATARISIAREELADQTAIAKEGMTRRVGILEQQFQVEEALRKAKTEIRVADLAGGEMERIREQQRLEYAALQEGLSATRQVNTQKYTEAEQSHAKLVALLQGQLAQGLINERDYANQVRALDQELYQAKMQTLSQYGSALQAALARAAADYTKYMQQIRDLDRQMREAKYGTEDILAQIKQAGMSPAEAFADREKRAQEKLGRAMNLSGQEQMDALKAVQQEYSALALEAARSGQVQAAAAKQARDAWVSDMPGEAFRHAPGQTSQAWQQFFGKPAAGAPGSAEWWAWDQRRGAMPEGWKPGQESTALGDAKALADKVTDIGKKIEAAYDAAKRKVEASASAAKTLADETSRNLSALARSVPIAEDLAKAYERAAAARASWLIHRCPLRHPRRPTRGRAACRHRVKSLTSLGTSDPGNPSSLVPPKAGGISTAAWCRAPSAPRALRASRRAR